MADRRSFLRAAMVGGGAALLSGGLAAGHASRVAAGAPSDAMTFFDEPNLNQQFQFALGEAGYGVAELGELLTVVNTVRQKGESYQSYYDAFTAMAAMVSRQGDASAAKGDTVSARWSYLRAAQYLAQALFFVLGTNDPTRAHEAATYAAMQDKWNTATTLFTPPFERVAIPYENTTLPGYLLKPDASNEPRPIVILNNGSDAQNVDLFAFGGAAAIERGYNALIFEGPGQGSMLFERNIPFRPDWEAVVTPVVDFLIARPDVDPARIAIVGWSFAGELVPRAAAFEHRLAAVAVDPGVVDAFKVWTIPQELIDLVNEGKREEANGAWDEALPHLPPELRFTIAKRSEIYGEHLTFYDLVKAAQQYNCTDVVHQITAPTLVMQPELEQFFPGQPQQLYDLLTAPKTLVTFTVAEGAQFHCEPMAPQRRNQVLFDWLAETLA